MNLFLTELKYYIDNDDKLNHKQQQQDLHT